MSEIVGESVIYFGGAWVFFILGIDRFYFFFCVGIFGFGVSVDLGVFGLQGWV